MKAVKIVSFLLFVVLLVVSSICAGLGVLFYFFPLFGGGVFPEQRMLSGAAAIGFGVLSLFLAYRFLRTIWKRR